jgi:restriction system protein
MRRKKEFGLDLIATLPWPVGVALGLIGFWAVRYGAGWYFSHSGGQLGSGLGRQFSSGSLAPLAWLLLAVCWIAAGVSYMRGRQRARLLQTRTDLESVAALD